MNTLYEIIHTIPISVLLVTIFGKFTGMPEWNLLGFIVCIALPLWIVILRHISKKNRLRSIGIVAVFLAALIIIAGDERRRAFLSEYGWIWWIVLTSAAAIVLGAVCEKTIWVKRGLSLTLIAYCIVGLCLNFEINKLSVGLICFLLFIHIAEEIQRKWKKSGYPDIKKHISGISPILLALCIAVTFIPAPKEPYGWPVVKTIYGAASELINKIGGLLFHQIDDYGTAGFSDNGMIISGLGSSNSEALSVYVDNDKITNLHLIGCITGDFSGRGWVFNTDKESRGRMIDTLETLCAVRNYDAEYQSDFISRVDLNIVNMMYNTKYMFAPSKTRIEADFKDNPTFKDKNGSILADNRMFYGDKYSLSCYMLNYNNPRLYELLDNARSISEDKWNDTVLSEELDGKLGYSYEDYQRYVNEINEKYLETDGVSDDVRLILDEIKSASTGKYEMMKILEGYLSSMEYTTSGVGLPSKVTDEKSFLDYFLLESQKGYCMHYATAFVLMARELGMPCRYVQGFSVTRDYAGSKIVRQDNAHAWPEVYFENVGWITFEPTPGYSADNGWKPWSGGESYTPLPEITPPPQEIDENENNGDVPSEEKAFQIDVKFIVIPAVSVVGFLIIFCICGIISSKKKYAKLSLDEKFKHLTKENLRYLNYLGFSIESGETLAEFTDRIENSDKFSLKEQLDFISDYEAFIYSNREITDEIIGKTEHTRNELREIVKKFKFRYRIMMMFRA